MSKEEFEQLQKIIESRQNYKKRNVKSLFIYQTKIVCPDCGNRLSSERSVWTRKTDKVQVVKNAYRCQVCALNHKDKTPFRTREVDVDSALMEYMSNLILEPSHTKETKEVNPGDDLLKEMKRIENQREKYQRAWASDLITDDEFKSRMDESRIRHDELKNELEKLKGVHRDKKDIGKYKEIAKTFHENFLKLTQEERRSFVQTFIEHIEIEVLERTKSKGYRNQKVRIADIHFY